MKNISVISVMKIRFQILLIILTSLTFLAQCKKKEDETNHSKIALIKKTYSKEAINYFHETAFFRDGIGLTDSISKWNRDILIYMNGTLWKNDSLYIKNTLNEINRINLPVKLTLTDDRTLANLHVYFGNYDYINAKFEITDHTLFSSKATTFTQSGVTESGIIGIANQFADYKNVSKTDSARIRQNILNNAIFKCLGILGDGWSQDESVYKINNLSATHLTNIDKEILQLLYEPAFPTTLLRKDFENNFKDQLHHIDSKEKVIRYVKENNVPLSQLIFIRDHCFHDSVFLKYPKKTFVKIEGNYHEKDYQFIQKVVDSINTSNSHLALEIEQSGDRPFSPVIRITYQNSEKHKSIEIEMNHKSAALMHPGRIISDIKLGYNGKFANQKKVNELLLKYIYSILCLRLSNLDIAYLDIVGTDTNGIPFLKQNFKEILSFVYNPVFPSGFTLKDMNEVISAIQSTHKPLSTPK